jgi:hypothetical protein
VGASRSFPFPPPLYYHYALLVSAAMIAAAAQDMIETIMKEWINKIAKSITHIDGIHAVYTTTAIL